MFVFVVLRSAIYDRHNFVLSIEFQSKHFVGGTAFRYEEATELKCIMR